METVAGTLNKLPSTSGVYLFKNSAGEVVYVGKAIDIRRRVKSYFRKGQIDPRMEYMVRNADRVETIRTTSEFDAITLEAKLIQELQPKFNVIAKDDKSPLYVRLTLSDDLPRISFVRKPQRQDLKKRRQKEYIGPFQSARIARSLLRHLRTVIPYCTQKRRTGTACFYSHLGLCVPCPSVIAKLSDTEVRRDLVREYRKNIFRLRDILTVNSRSVRDAMIREMNSLAGKKEFEDAAALRDHTRALDALLSRHFDPSIYLESPRTIERISEDDLRDLRVLILPYYPNVPEITRIECIDISHLGGSWAAGSLVVATRGILDPSEYRRFRVKVSSHDDLVMIDEVLTRRLAHTEWQYPDIMIVDGGVSQVGIMRRVLKKLNRNIAVIGLTKRYEEIIVPFEDGYKKLRPPLASPALQLVQRLRDEAHRFAKRYQEWMVRNSYRRSFV